MTRPADEPLARRIAMLFRTGLVVSTALLVMGVLVRVLGLEDLGSGMIVAGCATLVLLPAVRLLLMLDHFGRHRDRTYLGIGGIVLLLVGIAALIGLVT